MGSHFHHIFRVMFCVVEDKLPYFLASFSDSDHKYNTNSELCVNLMPYIVNLIIRFVNLIKLLIREAITHMSRDPVNR